MGPEGGEEKGKRKKGERGSGDGGVEHRGWAWQKDETKIEERKTEDKSVDATASIFVSLQTCMSDMAVDCVVQELAMVCDLKHPGELVSTCF